MKLSETPSARVSPPALQANNGMAESSSTYHNYDLIIDEDMDHLNRWNKATYATSKAGHRINGWGDSLYSMT